MKNRKITTFSGYEMAEFSGNPRPEATFPSETSVGKHRTRRPAKCQPQRRTELNVYGSEIRRSPVDVA